MSEKSTVRLKKNPFNLLFATLKKENSDKSLSADERKKELLALVLHYSIVFVPTIILCTVLLFIFPTELSISDFFSEHRKTIPLFAKFMRFYTNWGNWLFYIYFLIILILSFKGKDRKKKRKLFFAYLITQLLISLLLIFLLKAGLGRARPSTGMSGFHFFSLNPAYHSMPSGHTTEIATVSSGLATYYRKISFSILLGIVVLLMAFSRIYLSWHHPTDVLVSLFIAFFAALFMNYLAGRYKS